MYSDCYVNRPYYLLFSARNTSCRLPFIRNLGETATEEDSLQRRPRTCQTKHHAQCKAFQSMPMERKVGALSWLQCWEEGARVSRGAESMMEKQYLFPMNHSHKWYGLSRERLDRASEVAIQYWSLHSGSPIQKKRIRQLSRKDRVPPRSVLSWASRRRRSLKNSRLVSFWSSLTKGNGPHLFLINYISK